MQARVSDARGPGFWPLAIVFAYADSLWLLFLSRAVQGLGGREAVLLMGTAEIKESAERAAVFAVLDATNRWAEARRPS
jgi:hypothetical protein